MHKYLYLDIETIPAQRPDVMAEIRDSMKLTLESDIASIRPPGNYKKQETIDEWMANDAPKQAQALRDSCDSEIEAAYRKTGLDGAFGQICVIGFALDNQEPQTYYEEQWGEGWAETDVLECFYSHLTDLIPRSNENAICVVGHNVVGFDLRYMVQRSIVKNVQPHRVIRAAAQAKPWESDKVFDTMIQWGGAGARAGGSLDKLCRALSIPSPKSGITGATVWDAVRDGRITEVAKYCKADVAATRAAHLRMTFQTAPQPAPEMEDVPA